MEKMWYYAKPGSKDRQGPIPTSEIKALLAKGVLDENDLAWSEGMTNWTAVGDCAELKEGGGAVNPILASTMASSSRPVESPMAAAAVPTVAVTNELPAGLTNWMQFVGVMNIIGGTLYCLSCIGIIMGIPMIIAGNALTRCKTLLLELRSFPAEMLPFFEKLKSFSKMMGVFYIIMIVSTILFIIAEGIIFATVMSQLGIPRR